jgi:hypothetical protein
MTSLGVQSEFAHVHVTTLDHARELAFNSPIALLLELTSSQQKGHPSGGNVVCLTDARAMSVNGWHDFNA